MTKTILNFALIGLLAAFVLVINLPVINIEWIFPEEPLFFLANQQIHQFSDLLNIYLHPTLFHEDIPFFRPSGHFLMYQLLAPFIGWHQTKLMIAVNLIFMALTGYYMLRLYGLLFRGYWVGGLIACAIYLAHPSLFLVKISILHFEFAYTFFTVLGLYYFVLFCQINNFTGGRAFRMNVLMPLFLAILFYIIAGTFKESALMLGMMYVVYFCMQVYQGEALPVYVRHVLGNKRIVEFILMLCAVAILLGLYITSAWHKVIHPGAQVFSLHGLLVGMKGFFVFIFNWHILDLEFFQEAYFGAKIYFSIYMTVIMLAGVILTASAAIILFRQNTLFEIKKSFAFLFIALLFSLIIPLGWGLGYPWHFNLTLIMLSLMFGFSAEYICHQFYSRVTPVNVAGILLAVSIGLTSFHTNIILAGYYKNDLPPLYNAIYKPPVLAGKISKDSLLIVEDSIMKNAYALGAASYPGRLLYMLNPQGYVDSALKPKNYFLNVDADFSGTLFKWAFLNADIKEQVVPYNVDHLELVVTSLLYQWLQYYDNVYYITYDKQGNWHNLTEEFKKNLLAEKARRGLIVRKYHEENTNLDNRQFIRVVMLPSGDVTACQLYCDTERVCAAYRYTESEFAAKCEMYQ